MASNWRTGGLLVAGVAIGTVIGGWGVLQARKEAVWQPPAATTAMGNAPAQGAAPAAAVAPAPAVAVASLRCETTTVVPRGKEDGRASLQPTPSLGTASEVASLILDGKEAAASGRMRDAEIEFLNACRNAEQMKATDATPMADAMYQLARHYTNTARADSGDRKEMIERANRLYGSALQTYRARYGETGEKTRFAQQGLETVQQLAGGKLPPAPAPQVAQAPVPAPVPAPAAKPAPQAKAAPQPAPAPAVVAKAPTPAPAPRPAAPAAAKPPAPAPAPAEVAAARPQPEPAPAPAPRQEARRTAPSFDCARARSTTERLICGDEELARMDRELGRLHARSKSAAADPRAFQRQSDAQWAQREATCTDKECLRRWYAQRRQQLEGQQAEAPRAETRRPEAARTETPRPQQAARVEAPRRPAPAPAPRRGEPAPAPEAAMGANGAPTASGSVGQADGDAGQ